MINESVETCRIPSSAPDSPARTTGFNKPETAEIDTDILKGITEGKAQAFEAIYDVYYQKLCSFSYSIVKDDNTAEEIVQNLIFSVWERRESISITKGLKPYLYQAVYNNSLKHLKSQQRIELTDRFNEKHEQTQLSYEDIEISELRFAIQSAINTLPKKTKQIFRLSREEQLSYKEIADKTSLTVKSVEYHISKAIKDLHNKLQEFSDFTLLFVIFMSFINLCVF